MPPILAFEKISKRFGAVVDRERRSTSRSPRARRSASSGRTAPARPRCSASRPARCAPDAGRVLFAGADITRLPPERRCRLGIGALVPDSAAVRRHDACSRTWWSRRPSAAAAASATSTRAASSCSSNAALADKANRLAGALTLLDRKRLELARALATGPRVLLLDEVAGGLTEHECAALVALIKDIRAQRRVDRLDRARRARADRRRRPAGGAAWRRASSREGDPQHGDPTARRCARSTWGFRPMPEPLLEVRALDAFYGDFQALFGVSLRGRGRRGGRGDRRQRRRQEHAAQEHRRR